MQCVVDPLMTGIGGDCFALYSERGGLHADRPRPRRGAAAELDWFPDAGITTIGDSFRSHAVTVPGAVEAWCRLRADHGSHALRRAAGPGDRRRRERLSHHAARRA